MTPPKPPLFAPASQLAAGYVRLSKEHGDTNLSLEGMKKDIAKKAAQLGLTLVHIYVDDGLSGAIRNRPQFLDWLGCAREGKVGTLIPYHGDRLSREGANVAALVLDVIEGKDTYTGKVVSEPVRLVDCFSLDSTSGQAFRLMFVIGAEQARAERESIQRRNLATKQRLRDERGRYGGGIVPYGYKAVPQYHEQTGKKVGTFLEIEPDEADFVLHMVARVLQGWSIFKIMKELNELGSKPHRADYWSINSVLAVLRGEAILGRVCHKGQVLRDPDGMPSSVWEPIISPEEAERVRAAVAQRSRPTGPRRKRAARLLSGHVVCSSCGGTLVVNRIKVSGKPYARYLCKGHTVGRGCKRPVSISAERLDPFVEAEALRRYGHMEMQERIESLRANVELAEVESAIQSLNAQRAETDDEDEDERLSRQIKGLKARRVELREQPQAAPDVTLRGTGVTIAQAWAQPELRRDVLSNLLAGPIMVSPSEGKHVVGKPDLDRVEILWTTDRTMIRQVV